MRSAGNGFIVGCGRVAIALGVLCSIPGSAANHTCLQGTRVGATQSLSSALSMWALIVSASPGRFHQGDRGEPPRASRDAVVLVNQDVGRLSRHFSLQAHGLHLPASPPAMNHCGAYTVSSISTRPVSTNNSLTPTAVHAGVAFMNWFFTSRTVFMWASLSPSK